MKDNSSISSIHSNKTQIVLHSKKGESFVFQSLKTFKLYMKHFSLYSDTV